MTLTADQSLKDKWAAIFRRTGGDGVYTRLFDNLDASHRSKLLDELKSQGSEAPVIGSIADSRNWLILTTRRLVWCTEAKRQEIPVNIICDVMVDFQELQPSGPTRHGMRRLQVVTTNDSGHQIEVETGAARNGLWNVLKSITNPSWKEQRLLNEPENDFGCLALLVIFFFWATGLLDIATNFLVKLIDAGVAAAIAAMS